jgi:hypothetical protein
MDRKTLSLIPYAIAGCATAAATLYASLAYGPTALRYLDSLGYASLKPRLKEERTLRPLYDDDHEIPYPGDKAEMDAFMRRRFSILAQRKTVGLDAEKGVKLAKAEVKMLEQLRELDAEVDQHIEALRQAFPHVYGNQSVTEIKYQPAIVHQWSSSSSSSSPSAS